MSRGGNPRALVGDLCPGRIDRLSHIDGGEVRFQECIVSLLVEDGEMGVGELLRPEIRG
jgi:hypothetical protein